MIDRSHIGVVSEPRVIEVEKGQLKFFVKATGESDPIYFDEDAAHAAGHRGLPAPPTFLYSLGIAARAEIGSLFNMGINLNRVLHGEQSFDYQRQIYAGDTITLITTTKDIYEKRGGALEFVVQETTATNQHGEICGSMSVTAAVRNS